LRGSIIADLETIAAKQFPIEFVNASSEIDDFKYAPKRGNLIVRVLIQIINMLFLRFCVHDIVGVQIIVRKRERLLICQ
jgi:hypothetical protein